MLGSLFYVERMSLSSGRRLDPRDAATWDIERPVHRIRAEHGLSEWFSVEVEIEHDTPDLELEPLLWRNAVVDVRRDEDPSDDIGYHGVIEEAEYLRRLDDQLFLYRVLLRPRAHRLAYAIDTRIYQEMTKIDIATELLGSTGQRIELRLSDPYPPCEYVVQYGETELAFVQRLLEELGVFFWFEHSLTEHTLVLADDAGAHEQVTHTPALRFGLRHAPMSEDRVSDLRFTTRVTHDAHVARDWNWRRPNATVDGDFAEGQARRFVRLEYPSGADDATRERAVARRRHEEAAVAKYRLDGRAGCPGLLPGRRFTLEGARPETIDGDYLLTCVVHEASARESGDGRGTHDVRFSACPSVLPFRPPRRTPRPAIAGRDTAVVTGPSSEEIHVDEIGRVRAQLAWDRLGRRDEAASRWIRVVQPNVVGSMYLPRVGWEVAIGYVNGDPDRPVVTHQLYNQDRPPPYELPEALPATSWRSQSSPRAAGINEIRYIDTNLGMQFYVHAQRDMHTAVGNDRHEAVSFNSVEQVLGDLHTSVGLNEAVTVGIDQTTGINGRMSSTTGRDKAIRVAQLESWKVRDDHTVANDGDRDETIVGPHVSVGRAVNQTVRGNRRLQIGGAHIMVAGGAIVEAVGRNEQTSVEGARVLLVRGAHVETVERTKTLDAQRGLVRSHGPLAVHGADVAVAVDGALTEEVTEAFGMSGADVTVAGRTELRAAAGGSELLLGSPVLDVDASHFSGRGTLVRLIGQIELIGGDSADEAEPPAPGPGDDWVEIRLVGADGTAMAGEDYLVALADGTERSGTLDGDGRAREDGLPPGTVLLTFPNLRESAGQG